MNAHRAHGFTLLELLVAAAVSLLIVGAAFAVMNMGRASYQRTTRRETTTAEWRLAVGMLRCDCERTLPRRPMVVAPSSLGLLVLTPMATQSRAQAIGDVCAVRYHVRDVVLAGRTVRCLMRGVSESAEVFGALRANTVEALWRADERDEVLAMGVLAFQLKPLQGGASGGWKPWDRGTSAVPDAMEVNLILARPELAARLDTREEWDAAAARALEAETQAAGIDRLCFIQRIGCDEDD